MGLKSTLNLPSPLFGLPSRAPSHPTEEIKIKCHPGEYPENQTHLICLDKDEEKSG